jgi:hypothetical protein
VHVVNGYNPASPHLAYFPLFAPNDVEDYE